MNDRPYLRIGTRGSPLALAQTEAVRRHLVERRPMLAAPGSVEVVVIETSGDRVVDRPLADIGGKGLFTKEIDAAQQRGAVDVAVHSVKDLPTTLAPGLILAATLPRADPRDAFISRDFATLAALPRGSVVGSASLRRQAQILKRRPDLQVVPLRGNIHTRLAKVDSGVVDATLLALAGLQRLALAARATAILDLEEMLPAVGQGAIGITCRADDAERLDMMAGIDDAATSRAVAAERAMLGVLDGSCRTPIAGIAVCQADGTLRLRGLVATPDGAHIVTAARTGRAADAVRIGVDTGDELRRCIGPFWHSHGG